jgi:hypothetical protein
VLAHYSLETTPRYEPTEDGPGKPKQLRDFLKRMDALLDFWGDKLVGQIAKKTCREFAKLHAQSTARRLLEDLRAAVELSIADEIMAEHRVNFDIPAPNPARFRYFNRSQMAKLVWTAYRMRGSYTYSGKRARAENRGKTVVTSARPRRHIARLALFGAYTGTRKERMERTAFVRIEGHPFVDLETGIYYRSWDKEMVPDNKRADPIRLPDRLLAHCRRWHRMGATFLCEIPAKDGKAKPAGSTAGAFFRHLREIIPDPAERKGLNIHALKHTAATWLCVAGEPMSEIADYLSTDEKTIKKHYGHHHPDHQEGIGAAFTKGNAGRPRSRRAAAPQPVSSHLNPAVATEARRAVRDMLEIADAPVAAFAVADSTPDADLAVLREQVKRAARSGDWQAVLGTVAA